MCYVVRCHRAGDAFVNNLPCALKYHISCCAGVRDHLCRLTSIDVALPGGLETSEPTEAFFLGVWSDHYSRWDVASRNMLFFSSRSGENTQRTSPRQPRWADATPQCSSGVLPAQCSCPGIGFYSYSL
ncbi:hypothetical protein CSUI_006739 [Cystoisospora suis]|uniref:Uncharacterized protein n=1 Tax=Cystoisospora suis TaxID=483139 RepID=A0A2C6KT08_9APIC|nr:hypothetical protein CSUI_006739 [Cystoisospora suis]